MFKKTVKFTDFNGNEKTQDFYFHISKTEFLAMAANGDDMKIRIENIIKAQDGMAILNEFRAIIKLACGVRSEDGERFIKDERAQSTLLDSPAFDELLMELATNAGASTEFIHQLVPQKMQEEMLEQLKKSSQKTGEVAVPDPFRDPAATYDDGSPKPAYVRENRRATEQEMQAMTRDEMLQAWKWAEQLGK